MEITLTPVSKTSNSTISTVKVNGMFECYALEDTVREVKGQPVSQWKVAGKTAIPAGRYKVIVDMSNRFKRELPLLVNVPGFAGVRIHPGNSSADTEGCILPGASHSTDWVGESKKAFASLFDKIRDALAEGDTVWLEIER